MARVTEPDTLHMNLWPWPLTPQPASFFGLSAQAWALPHGKARQLHTGAMVPLRLMGSCLSEVSLPADAGCMLLILGRGVLRKRQEIGKSFEDNK